MRFSLLFLVVISTVAFSGCGFGLYQTAKTLPKGDWRIGLAESYQGSPERELNYFSFPGQFDFRIGVHERVDVGVNLFFVTGLLVDAKVNVMPLNNPFALAFSGGIGGGVDAVNIKTGILHIPLRVIASYNVGKSVTPYGSIGYGMWWIFNREKPEDMKVPEGETEVGRQGYGDGTMKFTAGIELAVKEKVALYIEYSYQHPVYDDPGDYYTFIPMHFAGIGIRF